MCFYIFFFSFFQNSVCRSQEIISKSFTAIDTRWSWRTCGNHMQSTEWGAKTEDSMAQKWITTDTRRICNGYQRRKRSDYTCINDGMIDSMSLALIIYSPNHPLSPIAFILRYHCNRFHIGLCSDTRTQNECACLRVYNEWLDFHLSIYTHKNDNNIFAGLCTTTSSSAQKNRSI